MYKLWIGASLLCVLVLGACAVATPESSPELAPETVLPQEATQAPTAVPTEAADPATLEPVVVPTSVDFSASGPASCTVVSTIPDPDPTQAAVFPPVTEEDWTFGPPDAAVTILEYSDFQ
jgi:ABC-type transport system substrate-binding protein